MNQTQIPALAASEAVAGFVFQELDQDQREVNVADRKLMETSCVDLISKLENSIAKAKELEQDDFIDNSAEIAGKMLVQLQEFSQRFLTGKPAEQANTEIGRATTCMHAYAEVLNSRPLTTAILRTFWKVDEAPEIMTSHARLGEALMRACAATLYHTIILLGVDTNLGKEIDQSTVVFVNELKHSW